MPTWAPPPQSKAIPGCCSRACVDGAVRVLVHKLGFFLATTLYLALFIVLGGYADGA